jgi:hypothetical protein
MLAGVRVVAIGCALSAVLWSGCGSSDEQSPDKAVHAFFDAAAAGDGAKACALLSKQAQSQFVHGTSCQQGIKQFGPVVGSVAKQAKVSVQTHGDSATATLSVNGRTAGTYELRKSGGKWQIVSEHGAGGTAQGGGAAQGTAAGPSKARVDAVAKCLNPTFGLISNYGGSSIGGAQHVTLVATPTESKSTAYVEVFGSPQAASSGLPGLQKYFRGRKELKLKGSSVLAYDKDFPRDKRSKAEACV